MSDIDALLARLNELRKIPSLSSLHDDQLAKMKMDELAYLRNNRFLDQASQDRIAPYEHRAYAREVATDNPFLAPGLALAAPIYQLDKVRTNGAGSRTGASFEQLKQGLMGTGEGLLAGINNLMRKQ